MNPAATDQSDLESYTGSEPLAPALADRFSLFVRAVDWDVPAAGGTLEVLVRVQSRVARPDLFDMPPPRCCSRRSVHDMLEQLQGTPQSTVESRHHDLKMHHC